MTSIQTERQVCAVIRNVLLRDWDPIGIQDVPEAQDEYDNYVGSVFTLVERRSSADEIFQYLWWVETDRMGLSGDHEKTRQVAISLAELRKQLGNER